MKPIHHRTLFNGDSSFLFTEGYLIDKNAPYTADVLHRFIDLLADSGVDTYIQNPMASKPWYPSGVLPSLLDGYTRGDREFARRHFPNADYTVSSAISRDEAIRQEVAMLDRLLDLQEAGIDWAREIAEYSRRRGISPWVSMRMNDLHGAQASDSFYDSDLRKNPEFRLRGFEINSRKGSNLWRAGVDFSHGEVRDYFQTMARELVEDYPFEGLELDWNRCPACIEAPASQKQIDVMTEWISQLRALTQKQSAKTGKPYPLGLCLPARIELLREIGLDVRAMAQENLIDFISPHNCWQATWDLPIGELRELVGDEVAIYGVIDDAPNWLPTRAQNCDKANFRFLSASAPHIRANAAGKLATGADGITFFNFFCTDDAGFFAESTQGLADYAAIKNISNLESLRGKPKHYALASAQSSVGGWMWWEWESCEQLPCTLEPETQRAFRVAMCAEPSGVLQELVIQIVVEKKNHAPEIAVSFNNSWPILECEPTDKLLFPAGAQTHHVMQNQAFNFRCDISRIKDGWNEIRVVNINKNNALTGEHREHAIRLVSLELAVR